MARQYANYSDQDIIDGAKEVKSLSGLLRKLGLVVAGGNFGTIKIKLKSLGVNCDHWTGSAWNKNQQLKDWDKYTKRGSFKKLLLKDRGQTCESCGLSEWCGKPIPLELDHIDGDGTNNDKENLKLLCCNCHALTPTWRGRACRGPRKEKEIKICPKCSSEFVPKYKSKKYCSVNCAPKNCKKRNPIIKNCPNCNCEFLAKSKFQKFCSTKCVHNYKYPGIVRPTKIKWPEMEEILKIVEENGYSKTGRILGVSDNAIRKHIARHGTTKSDLTVDSELP